MNDPISEHKRRMDYISMFAPPPLGTPSRETLDKWISSHPYDADFDKEMRKRFKKTTSIIDAQLENGASFPIDSLLRDFLLEYNGRNFQHGLRSMPSSFNVMEAFFEYVPDLSMFRLLQEKDHLFHSIEFLDYVTSGEAPIDCRDLLETLEERVIYSYNLLNNVADITFKIRTGREYGIGGAAIVRHNSEISILLMSGEKTAIPERTQELRENFAQVAPFPSKESIKPAEDRIMEAVPLLGNNQFWQTLVLSRVNLEDMTIDVRYVMIDIGNGYIIKSDDISILMSAVNKDFIEPRFEDTAKEMVKEIQDYETLFELSKTSLYLPLFFEDHSDDILVENHPTKLFQRIKKRGKRKVKPKYIGPREKITHRPVSILRMPEYQYPNRTFHVSVPLKLEVSGFWKKLDPSQVGIDKHGRPIHGRTWVEKTLTWAQSEFVPEQLVTERHTAGLFPSSRNLDTQERGYIYVMRSAAHAKDIFKIGLSRRSSEIRSAELSRATGVPDQFLIVQEWEVSDCVKAEKLIHQALLKYRMKPEREFFKAPYKVIVKAIGEVLVEVEGAPNHIDNEGI
jgi:hypothetical protein